MDESAPAAQHEKALQDHIDVTAKDMGWADDDDDAIGSDGSASYEPAVRRPAGARPVGGGGGGGVQNPESSHGSVIGSESSQASSSSRSSSSSTGAIRSDGEGPPDIAIAFPFTALGVTFSNEVYEDPTRPGRSHDRVVCTCMAGHPRCRKRRGRKSAQTVTHGSWEPIAYLLAWSRNPNRFTCKKNHVPSRPTAAEIAKAYEDLRDDGFTE